MVESRRSFGKDSHAETLPDCFDADDGCDVCANRTRGGRNGRAVTQKTNATRLLDQIGIRYELREYEVDPEDLAAEGVAAKIGLPLGQLFKTLVADGDRHGICMAVIPGDTEWT